jgi:hypothetical protein
MKEWKEYFKSSSGQLVIDSTQRNKKNLRRFEGVKDEKAKATMIWEGVERKEIARGYFMRLKKTISLEKLRDYMKALEMAGLVSSRQDPEDKRRFQYEPAVAHGGILSNFEDSKELRPTLD